MKKIVIRISKNYNKVMLNFCFILWFMCEFVFVHTPIAQAAMLLFVGCTAIVCFRKIQMNVFIQFYLMFILYAALNILTGHATDNNTAKAMCGTELVCLVFLIFFSAYCSYVGDVRIVLELLKKLTAILCVVCLLSGIISGGFGDRLSVFGLNANSIAMMAGYSLSYHFYDMKKRTIVWSDYCFLALCLVTILLSGSRKGIIIPIVALLVIECTNHPKRIVVYTLASIIGIIVAYYLLMNIDVLYSTIGHRIEAVVQLATGQNYTEASLQVRSSYIRLGWEKSQDGLLWGHGIDCFRHLQGAYNTYSHNNYIEILYSLGWPGVAIYYFPFGIGFVYYLSRRHFQSDNCYLYLAIIIPYLICDYMNVSYYERSSLIYPVMFLVNITRRNNIVYKSTN